jgi:hypothetical protein
MSSDEMTWEIAARVVDRRNDYEMEYYGLLQTLYVIRFVRFALYGGSNHGSN